MLIWCIHKVLKRYSKINRIYDWFEGETSKYRLVFRLSSLMRSFPSIRLKSENEFATDGINMLKLICFTAVLWHIIDFKARQTP